MAEIEISSGQETIITHSVLVQFLWVDDGWQHELISTGGCMSIPRIWAVGAATIAPARGRPNHAVHDKLVAEVDPSGVVRGTLTGRSGNHPFSQRFTVEEQPEEVTIAVEVNDHRPGRGDDLAAAYLIEASDGEVVGTDPVEIRWPHPNCRLIFEAEAPARVSIDEAGMGTVRLQAVAPADPAAPVQTLRYRWRWITHPARQLWDREV